MKRSVFVGIIMLISIGLMGAKGGEGMAALGAIGVLGTIVIFVLMVILGILWTIMPIYIVIMNSKMYRMEKSMETAVTHLVNIQTLLQAQEQRDLSH